jgi:hypothetical protein
MENLILKALFDLMSGDEIPLTTFRVQLFVRLYFFPAKVQAFQLSNGYLL